MDSNDSQKARLGPKRRDITHHIRAPTHYALDQLCALKALAGFILPLFAHQVSN